MSDTKFYTIAANSHRKLSATKLFQLTSLSCALALAGCGGGSGNTVDSIRPGYDGSSSINNGNNNGNNSGNNTAQTAIKIVEGTLLDTKGEVTNSVGLSGAYLRVKVVDEKSNPVAGVKVNFNIDAPGVTLSQSTSGAVLTDSQGKAQIFIKPENAEVSGAYTVEVSAAYNGQTATSNKTFAVQATSVKLGELNIENKQLPSGGQTPVTVKVTDENNKALSGVLVSLNSSCGQIAQQMVSDTDGMVEVVYKSINADNTLCSGNVSISASAGNVNKSQSLSIASPEATSILYTANDLTLGIKDSGSSATGQIEFTVYSDKTPLANQKVKLSLEKSPLGLTFGPNKDGKDYIATTDENGKVLVNIYPGTTPGPVEIKAQLEAEPSINALSKNITVASSRVTQTGLSLSWEKNVLDWGFDGDTAQVQARMVDRNGNTVPDGTVINFTAEGGKITPSCATVDGACKVTFSTQNPRPGDGRVSVLAIAEGEKDYIDINGNNAWDEGEDLIVYNIGDAYRDDNENHRFDEGEFVYPMTTEATQSCDNNLDKYINLKFPSITDLKRKQYKANYVAEFAYPNKPDTCNDGLDAIIRQQAITLLSNGNNAVVTIVDNNLKPAASQKIKVTDRRVIMRVNSGGFYDLNPMPSGTTISGTVVDKTDSKPIASASKQKDGTYTITVVNANPNATVLVKDGAVVYPVSTNSNGIGKVANITDKPEALEVEQEEFNCSVDMAGVEKVPANVATGKPGDNLGTISSFSFSQCRAGDLFKVTITSPSGNVTRYTYTFLTE